MRRFLFSLLVCLAAIAYADDRTLTGGEYWIDNAVNERVQVSIADGWINFTLNVGYLNEGLHALHYRAKDSEGFYSPTHTWLFFRYVTDVVGSSVLEYWFDEGNHQTVEVSGAEGNFVLDASALDEGLHTLHYQLNTLNGQKGAMHTWLFFRQLGKEVATKAVAVEYWADDRNDLLQRNMVQGNEIQFTFDASTLDEGLHSLNYRTQDDQGRYSPTQQWLFYRYVQAVAGGSMLEYWIDEDERHDSVAVTDSVAAFVLDASGAEEGLHTLHYRLNTLTGQTGAENTWLFYRVAPTYAGGSRTLEYWIDEGEHLSRSVDDADVTFILDASAMDEGLHTLHYQLKEEGGRVSPQQSWLFYRIASQSKAQTLKWYRFWWNGYQDKAIDVQLPDSKVEYLNQETLYLYKDIVAVPDYARNDGYSRDNTARFNIVFCDDQGQLSPVVSAVVSYPDVYPPVTTLTATKIGDSAKLSWQANADDIRDYNLYYSEDGQPYVLWKPNVTTTEATFRGQKGSTYRFIVTARDVNGNYEAMEERKAKKITF